MKNLFVSDEQKEFWIFVDPRDFLIQHNLGLIGSFISVPPKPEVPTLMFLPNPEFKTFVSPFQTNLLRNYIAEYNLELARVSSFSAYPCRLHAVFLLPSAAEAQSYKEQNPEHVGNRKLMRCVTHGRYKYSIHDSAWVNFLRLPAAIDSPEIADLCKRYWSGQLIEGKDLHAHGKPWIDSSVNEILYLGRIDFPDKQLDG